jgi:hypothetical protein
MKSIREKIIGNNFDHALNQLWDQVCIQTRWKAWRPDNNQIGQQIKDKIEEVKL